MTLNHRRWIMALGFTALLGASAVQAQEEVDRANVPFSFDVAGKQQEAGSYSAQREPNNVLAIRNNQSRKEVLVVPMLTTVKYDTPSNLSFERFGSHYVLRKVQFGNGFVYEIPRTKQEKELAKSTTPEVILVAMR
ncbi:MAG: hypothetical protein JO022_08245 [Acidobacteriaceae bacterium]|nr:hypothetical protein [Acidobacteriaceae bacterium]